MALKEIYSREQVKRKFKRKGWTRYLQTEADWKAAQCGCYIDESYGQHAVDFFELFLIPSEGRKAGEPVRLLEFQKRGILMPLLSWRRPNGLRRFRRAFVFIPKKNGKSFLGSGLGIYFTVADGELGAKVFCAAKDREQASMVYDEAANMVEMSEDLSAELKVIRSTKSMYHPATKSQYKALSADAGKHEGKNIHVLIFDELHVQKNTILWNTLKWGGAARKQPLIIVITTAGDDINSVCYSEYDYACKIRDGVIEEDWEYFQFILEADEKKDNLDDPAIWKRVNPSLGEVLDFEEFESEMRRARAIPADWQAWKRYRFNIWVEKEEAWMDMAAWLKCSAPPEIAAMKERANFLGVDLSTNLDLTAIAMTSEDEEGVLDILPYCWMPKEEAHRKALTDRVPYLEWAEMGFLELCEGNVINYETVKRKILSLRDEENFYIYEVPYDPHLATQLMTQLNEQEGFTCVPITQGFKTMTEPMNYLMGKVIEGKVRHGNHPVLRWMVSNVIAKKGDFGDYKRPAKMQETKRIDGAAATLTALNRFLLFQSSVYNKRGVSTL